MNFRIDLRYFFPVIISVLAVVTAAQDGSNIEVYPPERLTPAIIGKTIQLDLYRPSFEPTLRDAEVGEEIFDRVVLRIGGRRVELREHWAGDMYNNTFADQYLESIDKKMRITEFELLKIDVESITVRARLNVEPFSQEFKFAKKDIAEVLVKSEQ
jgi:hypothetical protein